MKYIKRFNESLDPELEEVKSFMVELAQDWDIYWVDNIDYFDDSQAGQFIYTIRYIEGNEDWKVLIDIMLPRAEGWNWGFEEEPYVREHIDEFLADIKNIETRLKTLYDKVEIRDFNFDNKYDSSPQIQIVMI